MKAENKEMEINGVIYVPKDSVITENKEGMKPVLIRSYAAGVHFGYLKSEEYTEAGCVVTLVETQRVWYWAGANSLSQLALEGTKNPDECKISVILPENKIVNVIEIIPLTNKALNSLKSVKIWQE